MIDIKQAEAIIENGVYLERLILNYLTENQFSF